MNEEIDELKLYYGDDIQIADGIVYIQPTLKEIKDFGEKRYFSSVYTFTSVGADLKWQLWEMGIDYTQIEDYDLFIKALSQILSSQNITNEDSYKYTEEELKEMSFNPLKLILKDIDFSDFEVYKIDREDNLVLYNKEKDILIDRMVYRKIVDIIRSVHGLKRNNETPANEITKMDLIEDARDELIASSRKPYRSTLKSYISTISVMTHINIDEIWNWKIGVLIDIMRRINRVEDATLLLQGAYSGFTSLKDIDRDRLNWSANLD